MKLRKIFFTSLVSAIFSLLYITAWAALPSNMWIEGANQGSIEGSSQTQGREGSIDVYAFGHSLAIPTDVNSGRPTGQRIHKPFKILKTFDKSSPKLYQALVTGEPLIKVEIKFYRINPDQQQEHYFTVKLESAIITNISPSMPTTLLQANEAYRHMETVSFTYQKITWTWLPDGVETIDTWGEPR